MSHGDGTHLHFPGPKVRQQWVESFQEFREKSPRVVFSKKKGANEWGFILKGLRFMDARGLSPVVLHKRAEMFMYWDLVARVC